MMRIAIGVVMVMAAGMLARPAWADKKFVPRDVPLEVMATEADAIVVGTVVKTDAREQTKGVGGGSGAVTRVKVDSVIANNSTQALEGKEISVSFNYIDPSVGVPAKGKSYVAMIKQAENRYYTLPYNKAYMTDTEAARKATGKAGDLDQWDWGKESNGLRAVALVRSARLTPDGKGAAVQMAVGLRNAGKEPVFVNLYGGDRVFTLKASWDGTALATSLPGAERAPGEYEAESKTVEIKPGKMVWVTHWGVSSEGTGFTVQAAGDEVTGQVTYASSREGSVRGGKLWQGSVSTQEVKVKWAK